MGSSSTRPLANTAWACEPTPLRSRAGIWLDAERGRLYHRRPRGPSGGLFRDLRPDDATNIALTKTGGLVVGITIR